MLHRFTSLPLVLAVLALSLVFAGAAVAAGTPPTQTEAGTPATPVSLTVAVDKVMVKLNALEDQLDAMTLKLDATTATLDATTAKLDALTLKTKVVYDTVLYSKGYLQGGLPTIMQMIDQTCNVADDARLTAEYAAWGHPSQVINPFQCP